jgi:mRNA-degrading endonuclease YafQ of YafQ-DinJ toxin-antitoxin module
MNLRYSREFAGSFLRLPAADKRAVIHILELFQGDPWDESLRNHALAGKMTGKRALVVDHDLRIIFTERNNYRDVTLLDVGGHADVYRH